MKSRTKTVAVTALAITLGGGLYLSRDDERAMDADQIVNRPWIERMPHDEKDMIGHFLLLDQPGAYRHFGTVGRSSRWRHVVEIFKWALEGQRLSVAFPQSDMKGKVNVRAWNCKGEAPRPFELCLEISAGQRTTMYYSREDWEVRPRDVEAGLAAIREDAPMVASSVERALGLDADARLETFDDASLPETPAVLEALSSHS